MTSWPGVIRHLARRAAAATAAVVLLAGPPYGLIDWTGSPLPRHLPDGPQLRAFLAGPLTDATIIRGLADVVWVLWAIFALSILTETAAALRGRPAPRLPGIAPVQALAAALAGTALLTTAVPQPSPRCLTLPATLAARIAATAPPQPARPSSTTGTSEPGATAVPARTMSHHNGPGVTQESAPRRPLVHRVTDGDNLWDIAARYLGTGERWHEIYHLNAGKPQPDGRALTNPALIYPGWVLLLPPAPAAQAPAHPRPHPHRTGVPGHLPSPRHSEPARVPRPAGLARGGHGHSRPPATANPAHRRHRSAGIHLPSGGLAGITLAAAISAAFTAWRLHRRRVATPRWPIPPRTPEPLPHVISALRRAGLRSAAADEAGAHGQPWPDDEDAAALAAPGGDHAGTADCAEGGDDAGLDEFGAPIGRPGWPQDTTSAAAQPGDCDPAPGEPGRAAPGDHGAISQPGSHPRIPSVLPAPPATEPWRPAPPPARPLPPGTVSFGVRGGTEIPLQAVAAPGLGLTGPGAPGTARALLTGLLAARGAHGGPQVIMPEADFRKLTGEPAAPRLPGVTPGLPRRLVIPATLAEALARFEAAAMRQPHPRGMPAAGPGAGTTPDPARPSPPSLALIARPDSRNQQRIQAAMEKAAEAAAVVILLGDCPAETTCHIGPDGIVTGASTPALEGAQAFHLPAADTAALLSLLRGADGDVTDDAPPSPPAASTPPDPAISSGGSPPGPAPQGGGTARPATSGGHIAPWSPVLPAPAAGSPPAGPAPGNANQQRPGEPEAAAPAAAGSPAARPVEISVLGPLRITADGAEIRGGLRKARELLAYLAFHPDGVTGENISEALWPESDPAHSARQRNLALRKAREMLRTATGRTRPMWITLASDRYRLDPALIGTDLQRFTTALAGARTAGSEDDQLAALRSATSLYHGTIDDEGYDWADQHTEPLRRQALDALARIAALLTGSDPEQALAALETAIEHDPYNEATYQQIMDLQNRLGRPDAARRTLRLLEARLAELGQVPGPAARQAAASATGNQPGHAPATPTPPAAATARTAARTAAHGAPPHNGSPHAKKAR